jgi:hypothetical protein
MPASLPSARAAPWSPPPAATDRHSSGFGRLPVSTLAAALAGLLTPFTLSLGGAMPVGELLLLVAVGWALVIASLLHVWPSPLWRSPVFLLLLAGQALALLAYVVSDAFRGSAPHDFLRGWSRMVFLALDLLAIAYLVGCKTHNFVFLLLGIQLGEILKAHLEGALFGDYWKFGYALPVTIVSLLVAGRGGLALVGATAAALGVAHFMLDFRSLGLLCLLVAALSFVQAFPRPLRAWLAPLGLACGLGLGLLVYAHTKTDREGQRSTRSNVERSAMVAAGLDAFLESPLLGHGSWFSRSNVIENFMILREEGAREAGVGGFAGADEDDEPVALHSQLLVVLAEGGLLGSAFFLPYVALLLWALRELVIVRDWSPLATLRVFVLSLALFNAFLSPFSGAHRVNIALAAVLVVLVHRERSLAAAPEPEARA